MRLTCNRGDNHGGEEGAVPWELTGERKIPGGVGEARWDVKAWCYLQYKKMREDGRARALARVLIHYMH